MSSPTNLIQYLFGKDAAGGDRGNVRDKLEKQKQLENQTLDQSLINLGISTDDSKKINPLNPLVEYNNELFRQKFLGGNTSDLGDPRARQLNKDLIKERYIQQPLQNNNASAIRSQFRPDAFQRSEVGGYPGGRPSQEAPYFVSVDRSSDRNQIPMTRYPNYRDKRVVDAAIAMGKDTALDMNQETKKEGFIASLLGDIDFKSLAKSPLVMQALQGLSRMPTNQAQFGDSMVTGFTRGMQQFGAEEQAKAKEQAAIDLEQSRYDAQQAASAASTAESLRRYEEGRTLDRATLEARRLQNYIKQNEIATKTDTDNYKKSIAQLIRKNPVIKDIIKSEKGGFFSKLSEEDIIEQTIGEAIIIYNSRLGTQDQVNKKDAFVLALGSVSGGSLTSSQENSAKDTVANAYRVDGKSLVKSK